MQRAYGFQDLTRRIVSASSPATLSRRRHAIPRCVANPNCREDDAFAELRAGDVVDHCVRQHWMRAVVDRLACTPPLQRAPSRRKIGADHPMDSPMRTIQMTTDRARKSVGSSFLGSARSSRKNVRTAVPPLVGYCPCIECRHRDSQSGPCRLSVTKRGAIL